MSARLGKSKGKRDRCLMRSDSDAAQGTLLFVCNVAWFFTSHRLEVARAAQRNGYKVHVAADVDREEEIAEIESHGILFHRIRVRRSATAIWGELTSIFDIYRLVSKLRPDLVHHVTIKPVLYGSLVARLLGTRSVVNALPGLGYLFTARGPLAALRREMTRMGYRFLLNGRNSLVIFQNSDDLNSFVASRTVPRKRTRLIRGSGVDLAAFASVPEPPGIPIVVLPARMLWDKGIREFCEAAVLHRAAGGSARFVLVGSLDPSNPSGATKSELQALCEQTGVEWLGYRDDMVQVLAQSHIVCLPSYREGLPKALIEAAAMGRPIVSCDVPGCREVVREGINGFLVNPRDPVSLAAAISKLVADVGLRQSMGTAGRKLAEEDFGLDSVIEKTLAVYADLASAWPPMNVEVSNGD